MSLGEVSLSLAFEELTVFEIGMRCGVWSAMKLMISGI